MLFHTSTVSHPLEKGTAIKYPLLLLLLLPQTNFPLARLRQLSQKPGDTPGEGLLPTCAMSLEASAILLKSLGATGLMSPAADALAKKNPAIQASAKQLAEAGKKMHPTLNQKKMHPTLNQV